MFELRFPNPKKSKTEVEFQGWSYLAPESRNKPDLTEIQKYLAAEASKTKA